MLRQILILIVLTCSSIACNGEKIRKCQLRCNLHLLGNKDAASDLCREVCEDSSKPGSAFGGCDECQ